MGKVDDVVAVNQLGGVRRAYAVWERGPYPVIALGRILLRTNRP